MRSAGTKGPGRPILPAADRAELVAALARRGLRHDLSGADRGAAADAAAAGRPLQGHRLHRRTRCPSGRPCWPTAAASRSSAIPRIIPRATCSVDPRMTARDPAMNFSDLSGSARSATSSMPCRRRRRCARRFPMRGSTGSSTRSTARSSISSPSSIGRSRSSARRWPAGPTSRGACGSRAYDAAIDLQGLLKSAVLARASGAPRVLGFSIWHLREKTARPFYSDDG